MKLAKVGVVIVVLVAGFSVTPAHAQELCRQGYVWREAFPGDRVCVTPGTRTQAASDNSQASSRRVPGGSDTCRQGYVWREARPSDHVCVTPQVRTQTASDNRQAANRLAKSNHTCTIFEHRDYGGAHWTLQNGDDLKMISPPDVGVSDGIHRFIYEPSWNDKVSSFQVGPTCTLTLWEHVDRGGHYFRASKSYKYVGDAWNDKASEAVCECAGLSNW